MSKLQSKIIAKYYLWKLKRLPFERVLQNYSKDVEKIMLKNGRDTSKIEVDDKIFNIWSKIQNSWLKKGLGNVGKNYSKDDFIENLKDV